MNEFDQYGQQGTYQSSEHVSEQGLSLYISKVFMWMFLGLIVTAVVSYFTVSTPALLKAIVLNRFIFFGLIIGEFILVVYFSARITKMSTTTAIASFIGYSILNGLTLSVILLVYTLSSISFTFLITAVTFGVMSIYGRVTKTDLTQFRAILMMGLFGVIILSVVNIFARSSSIEWIISIVGLFVFLGLTAYDTQKLKHYYYATEGNTALRQNLALMGALRLYLDFINLFLMLLRLFGRRR